LSEEKTTNDITRILKIIKDEIDIIETTKNIKIINKDTEIINKDAEVIDIKANQTSTEIQTSKTNLDALYAAVPEDFKYQENKADPTIQAETDNLLLKAKDKLQGITEEQYKMYLYTAPRCSFL